MTVTAANLNERDAAYDIVGAIERLLIGDKGYIRPRFKAASRALGIDLQMPLRKNLAESRLGRFLRLLQRKYKRVARKNLAHTFAVPLDLRLGRKFLQLDGAVSA